MLVVKDHKILLRFFHNDEIKCYCSDMTHQLRDELLNYSMLYSCYCAFNKHLTYKFDVY